MTLKVGKRWSCPECGQTVMVAKGSEQGELRCCESAMVEEGPRKLGSSD
jgi:hypothetical protein